MSKIVVTNREGVEEALDIRPGLTLMQTITDAGLSDLLALCGGVHTCAGAPLARAEVATILNRFFDRTSDIAISEAMHGKPGNRRYQFEPSFIIRGLENLHLELKPA